MGPVSNSSMFQASVEEETKNKSKLSDLIATKGNIRALYLSLGMVTSQQFCGINAVLFYSQTIFTNSGGSLGGAEATIIIGVVMFLSSGITPLVVERLGRKLLLLASAVGMIIGLVSDIVVEHLQNSTMLRTAFKYKSSKHSVLSDSDRWCSNCHTSWNLTVLCRNPQIPTYDDYHELNLSFTHSQTLFCPDTF